MLDRQREVLDAIRALDAESAERHPELWARQVLERLGRPENDAETHAALAWLADQGYIETVTEVDQIPGPLSFRLTY